MKLINQLSKEKADAKLKIKKAKEVYEKAQEDYKKSIEAANEIISAQEAAKSRAEGDLKIASIEYVMVQNSANATMKVVKDRVYFKNIFIFILILLSLLIIASQYLRYMDTYTTYDYRTERIEKLQDDKIYLEEIEKVLTDSISEINSNIDSLASDKAKTKVDLVKYENRLLQEELKKNKKAWEPILRKTKGVVRDIERAQR